MFVLLNGNPFIFLESLVLPVLFGAAAACVTGACRRSRGPALGAAAVAIGAALARRRRSHHKSCHEYSAGGRCETNWNAREWFMVREAEVQYSDQDRL